MRLSPKFGVPTIAAGAFFALGLLGSRADAALLQVREASPAVQCVRPAWPHPRPKIEGRKEQARKAMRKLRRLMRRMF